MSDLAAQEIRFVTAGLPELQTYLLSQELYWPLGGSLPRLTPGSLLLSLRKLQALDPAAGERLLRQCQEVRQPWQSAWKQKTARETANRLRLWGEFLAEAQADPQRQGHSYRSEVRGRVILQLLLTELPNAPERAPLSGLDAVLRQRLQPGPFLWQPELQPAFTEPDFWFLYGAF